MNSIALHCRLANKPVGRLTTRMRTKGVGVGTGRDTISLFFGLDPISLFFWFCFFWL
jgi:hypothetical protein